MQTKETDRINYGIYIEMSNDESVSGISSNSSRKLQTLCILTRHFARALRTRWMNEEGNASSSMAGKLRALITFFASFSPSASITMVGSVQVGNGVSYAQTPIMCVHIYIYICKTSPCSSNMVTKKKRQYCKVPVVSSGSSHSDGSPSKSFFSRSNSSSLMLRSSSKTWRFLFLEVQ